MIKMYINNEEVVSNKEFTISEEMLATPSTVLNNCYPALWENTKDYVSKFYFPKDYSKCIIGDGEFEKGSQRNIIKKVSGISPSFETNITKPWESLTIDGKSTQETTEGKNLIGTNYITGVTLNDATTNDITIRNNWASTIVSNENLLKVLKPSTTYTISYKYKVLERPSEFGRYNTVYILGLYGGGSGFTNFGETQKNTIALNTWDTITKTFTTPASLTNYKMIAYDFKDANNTTVGSIEVSELQIEEGLTATTFEPYTNGPSPNPDYPSEIENVKGKNLLNLPDGTYTNNGVTATVKGGIVTINGTATATSFVNIPFNYTFLANTNYTLSVNNTLTMDGENYIRFNYGQAVYFPCILSNEKSKYTNNFNENTIVNVFVIRTENGKTYNNFVIKPQLEKSSDATRYVPYGNIQIVETGKNLFDKDNVNSGYRLGPDGKDFADKGYNVSKYFIEVIPNKTYLTNWQLKWDECLCTYDKDKNFIRRIQSGNTLLTGNNEYFIKVSVKDANLNIYQVEKGTTVTPYEPYKEEVVNIGLKGNELCSLPNGTKDELIVKDGRAKIIKRIGKVVLDGLIWKRNTGTGDIIYWTTTGINNIKYVSSNIELGLGYAEKYKMHIGKGMSGQEALNTIAIDISHVTVNSYESPTGIFYYELAEPYEIDLGEVTLPNTLIGQNNVTLDATLETNMEISYYYSSYDLLFAGVVKKTGNISLNPRYPHYADIQVLDFKTFLSEGETLNFVIDNKTIGQAIDMVIDAIKSYGFVKGNIMLDDINEVIGAYSTDKKTAYDVFQYFSDITNSRWFTRMIDEDTVAIDFYDTDKLPVKPKIEYTEDWFCNNLIDDMSYSIKTDDYRNKQILLSDEVFGSTPYNDLLTSNGYDTSYTTTGKIASLTSAKIDGKNATFTTEANKEGGVEADIYYKPGEVGITTNNQIGAGKVIEITYIPLVEGREIIINDEEVNRIGSQLNRNGVISRYENRNDTTSSDELRQIGQTYIKYKGKAEVTLKITSRKNIYDIGDKVQFDAPLEDLSTEYMVKKKTTKYIVTANQLFYDYELSSSFNSESEINYFDNQRSKHKGNLSEGDYITRDIDITNSANIIWHDTSIDEISITGNNILDCALDSPFTD